MIKPLNNRVNTMALQIQELGDIAGRFDVSDEEAERIASCVNTESEFIAIWENDAWWRDGVYLSINMDQWPDTWERIKRRLKSPDQHFESGWIQIISEQVIADSSGLTDTFSHEISGHHTVSGNPETIDIPVVWNLG